MRPALVPLILAAAAATGLGINVLARAQDREPAVPLETIQSDLRLEAKLTTPKVIEPGQPVRAELTLVNRSAERSHRVVKPGDGSGVGWREPHVFWTAERLRTDGGKEPADVQRRGRCGVFDANWEKDVVTLPPGDSLDLTDWIPSPRLGNELDAGGTFRLTAHYAYRGGKASKGRGGTVNREGLTLMEGVPAFELRAVPFEVTVVRKLRFDVRVRRAAACDVEQKLSELVDVRIANRTAAPLSLEPMGWRVRISMRWPQRGYEQVAQHEVKAKALELAPGASTSVLGSGPLARGADVLVTPGDTEQPIEVVIALMSLADGGPRYHSDPLRIPVR